MQKLAKWLGIVLAALIGLLIVAAIIVFVVSNARVTATYDVQVDAVEIPSGEAALAQGKHIAIVRSCTDCHAGNLAGKILIDEPPIGRVVSRNLTAGQGGIGSSYSDEDWVRSIRHGVGPDRKPLMIMPSHEFYFLSDDDLGTLTLQRDFETW